MKKIYTIIATASVLISSATQTFAQTSSLCTGVRFHNYVFPTNPTPVSGIVYGSNLTAAGTTQSLVLDVYQPVGDVATSRPLVIMVHGGSFIGGSRTGPDVVPLCQDLAKLGYVTATIDYRLGMTNFPIGTHTVDSADAGAALMRAVGDARAAVRFFRKNARIGGNTYKIDTNYIFMAGVSAGALTALHLAYLDQWSEFPSYIDTTGVTVGQSTGQPGMHGGIEGSSGNPGYPSTVNAIVNICGALGDTAWMHTGDIPVLSFHGNADGTVPYGYATISVIGNPLLRVCGSSIVAIRANHLGIPNCMETWWGQDHTPEVQGTNANYQRFYDSTINITRTFLEHFTCGTAMNCSYGVPLGVNELLPDVDFTVFPNPAASSVTIDLSAFTGHSVSIEMYDMMGRKVKCVSNLKSEKHIINRDNLPNGMYFINIVSEGKVFSKKVMFE